MAAPQYTIAQMPHQNPHATAPLFLTVLVVSNTSDGELARNIHVNAARDLPWLAMGPAHDRGAVMVGGGPSAEGFLDQIRALQDAGGTVFAMNGASRWLRGNAIPVDHQVIADAKPETASLVDPLARGYLFASQVDPNTMDRAREPTVWHLAYGEIEGAFPEERRKRGGYAMIGGGASVGNSALCVAYAMGYRKFEIFGYDSSHSGQRSHAYDQPMNRFIPCADVEWAGKVYHCSIAMKAQAERFQITGRQLIEEGCTLNVHGDGLLPAMWNTPPRDLTERDKYRLIWQFDGYRETSPGEALVETFLSVAKPGGLIIDLGCGTGRAGLKLADQGHGVLLTDFADNCRDQEALRLPFIEWDLTRPSELKAPFGFCADVMEHIPGEDVKAVLSNVMRSCERVFFHISTVKDKFGAVISAKLHNTVKPHYWWTGMFNHLGIEIIWSEEGPISSSFFVKGGRNG